ncbi:2Fe-2S ferredoxin [Pseudonocardia sp. CNS-139]|nr:2Fe-2S ferredoxin [Pseudonocardia sp. CNS-139]
MSRHVVGTPADVPPGEHKVVTVDGREIGIFNLDGEFYAVRNRCPHQGGPLCSGIRTGAVSSPGPGRYDYDERGTILRCPWHQWEFEITTGRSWCEPDRVRVRAYPVSVETGAALAAEPGERVPGPYTAETYPVSVEEDYLVLDLSGRAGD